MGSLIQQPPAGHKENLSIAGWAGSRGKLSWETRLISSPFVAKSSFHCAISHWYVVTRKQNETYTIILQFASYYLLRTSLDLYVAFPPPP